MLANSKKFPWPPFKNQYDFFEKFMEKHSCVAEIKKLATGLYIVERSQKTPRNIKAFVCDCYSFGYAEFEEVIHRFDDISAIIIMSVWCGYTRQVKEECIKYRIGLFSIKEFMGALNHDKFWSYELPEN